MNEVKTKKPGTFTVEFIGEFDNPREIECLDYRTEGAFVIMDTTDWGVVTMNMNAVKLFKFEPKKPKKK